MRILKFDGTWAEGDDEISGEALKFYTDQFTRTECIKDYSLLQHIQSHVIPQDLSFYQNNARRRTKSNMCSLSLTEIVLVGLINLLATFINLVGKLWGLMFLM
ncbi:hypothetical protein H5410_002936 [Solanum commersonii]|uniref:Uncharacterized protein n=1 Tax=Solanum commersonii TaxID=4109 RepID=A0A9J6B3M2_SOLCO|nr:hypothetical protein H5410_002936 [Solanum commersonii]